MFGEIDMQVVGFNTIISGGFGGVLVVEHVTNLTNADFVYSIY